MAYATVMSMEVAAQAEVAAQGGSSRRRPATSLPVGRPRVLGCWCPPCPRLRLACRTAGRRLDALPRSAESTRDVANPVSAKNASRGGQGRGTIRDAVSTSERPAEAEGRAVPGHSGGRPLGRLGRTHTSPPWSSQTRFLVLVKVEGKDTETVAAAPRRRCGRSRRSCAGASPGTAAGNSPRTGSSASPRRRRLLLRPAGALAAWHEREHERAPAPVLPEEDRPLRLLTG